MARVPVPSVPSELPEVTLVTTAGSEGPYVVLVVPGATEESPGESASAEESTGAPVCARDGSPLSSTWTPVSRVTGKAAEVRKLPPSDGVPTWLLGIGAGEAKHWRSAGAALIRAADAEAAERKDAGDDELKSVLVELPPEVGADAVEAFVLGLRLGGYTFTVTEDEPKVRVRSVRLLVPADRADELRQVTTEAAELAEATALARDLANAPSNIKDPDWLASTAQRVVEGLPGLSAVVRDERWLAEHGFGGILAVGGGSSRPPRLIEFSYKPEHSDTHLLLVGKGITFDTGGFSLKPAEGMHLMRTDMSGGAAVIGAMRAIARLGLPVRVSALVPAAENHVSGSAYRPGDVLRHYGGTTTEIGNTDAEGRIVLADALAYGIETFEPDAIIDIATLTGAMKVALGLRTGGVLGTDPELVERIADAGASVGETWWPMPLLDEHAEAVRSEIADVRQTPPGPGGITAALFLREFVAGLPWAHLDIAGPARSDKIYDEVTPGGTGFGARTLVRLVASYA